MASPACDPGILRLVAFQAADLGHIHLYAELVASGHGTMASFTIVSRLPVQAVAELYELGKMIDGYPLHIAVLLCEHRQPLNRRAVGFDRLMAGHAGGGSSDTHGYAGVGIGMAGLALQGVDGVSSVAERQGLHRWRAIKSVLCHGADNEERE